MSITPEIQAKLRDKFDAEKIGYKPKSWCKACSQSRTKVCDQHKKVRCATCKQNVTEAHLDIEFVGHANVTDRLLAVDPEWTWEPLAYQDGLPKFDADGGLWIKLTVAGHTRLGYGDADGKTGGDAVKETIGDAIKIAAMRFGVGLDLRRKEEASGKPAGGSNGQVVGRGQAPAQRQQPRQAPQRPSPADQARTDLAAMIDRHKWDEKVVKAKFAAEYPDGLDKEADPSRIKKFANWLTSQPQHELTGEPAAAANRAHSG